ncbi:Uncharacterised protein [Klebsiella variicola]|nr:Uncharacterised protein [Klebsiella variicola]
MDLARLLSGGVKREHPHAATEPHPDVEKLDVQFAFFDVVPQRVVGVILDAVISLRSQIGQRRRQIARGAAPWLARQIVGHRLQHGVIETTRLPVGNTRVFGKSGLTE